MPQIFSSVRWAVSLPVALLWVVVACDSPDRVTSVSDLPTSPEAAASTRPTASFSSSFRGGIPFGTWGLPTNWFGDVYNGATKQIEPNQLLRTLALIKANGGRIVLAMAGKQKLFRDADGHFSLTMWKARIDRYKGVDFTSYIDDGTIIGHYILDEPNDPSNWSGQVVDGPTVEAMAAYSKQLWPNMPTIVRTKPAYLAEWGPIYRNLDAAWAQYTARFGDPVLYISSSAAVAKSLGLSLISGLNILLGDIGGQTPLSAAQVQTAGTAILANDYPCAFIMWTYDSAYLRGPGIPDAMTSLSAKASQHSARTCAGQGKGNPPPPPPNQLPTAAFTAPSCSEGVACQFNESSTDSDGQVVSWSWDFGDGSSSSEHKPSHTFTPANTYTVKLTVTDDDGGSNSISLPVVVGQRQNQDPIAAFVSPNCSVDLACQFTDGSTDPDGSGIASRAWAFGDGGTSSETDPTHSYSAANTYTVTLTVTNNRGATKSVSGDVIVTAVQVNQAPTAAFDIPNCTAGSSCTFTDRSSDIDGSIASRSWAFPGAAANEDETNPSITFASAGSYPVTLTVTDNQGATNSITRTVVVAPTTLPGNGTVVLSLKLITVDGLQKVRLSWKGATGSMADLWRNGVRKEATPNDGLYVRAAPAGGATYQICEAGSTSRCSNAVSTSGSGPSPSPITIGAVPDLTLKPGVMVSWSGAVGNYVDFYRDGVLFKGWLNNGSHLNTQGIALGGTYTLKICQEHTSNCSGSVTVTVR